MAAKAGSACASAPSHETLAPGAMSIDASKSSERRENCAGLRSLIEADDAGD
jgi:hypothetical protein